jgi:hypothetical protein
MILGFDHDDPSIFRAQREFVRAARIPHAMVGMLAAIPKTPLHARLAAEGRLDPDDVPAYGTNVIPLRMSRQELLDGYVRVLNELYEPAAYFDRLEEAYLRRRLPWAEGRARYWESHRWQRLKAEAGFWVRSAGLFARLQRRVPDPALRAEYRKRVWRLLRGRRDPSLLFNYLLKCAIHYHHYTMAREMAAGGGSLRNSF